MSACDIIRVMFIHIGCALLVAHVERTQERWSTTTGLLHPSDAVRVPSGVQTRFRVSSIKPSCLAVCDTAAGVSRPCQLGPCKPTCCTLRLGPQVYRCALRPPANHTRFVLPWDAGCWMLCIAQQGTSKANPIVECRLLLAPATNAFNGFVVIQSYGEHADVVLPVGSTFSSHVGFAERRSPAHGLHLDTTICSFQDAGLQASCGWWHQVPWGGSTPPLWYFARCLSSV